MSDFTTLACPNCGAPLKAAAYTRTLKCPFCGTQHIIHPEDDKDLFAFLPNGAVCPVCQKNDRVGSVPLIVSNPTDTERATGLAKQLILPEPQYYPANEPERGSLADENVKMPGDDIYRNSLIMMGTGIFIAWVDIFVLPDSNDLGRWFIVFGFECLCFLGAGLWMWWFSNFYLLTDRTARKAEVARQRQLAAMYPEALKRYQWEVAENQKIAKRHQARQDVWQRLYYCARDHCVYIPGEEMRTSPERMMSLIESNLQETIG